MSNPFLSLPSRIGLTILCGFFISIRAPVCARAEDSAEPSIQDIFKTFREKQSSEHGVAEQDQQRLLSHIAKIKELRAALILPKDAREVGALDHDMEHDQAALAKAEERIRLAEASIQGEFVGVPVNGFGIVERAVPAGWEPLGANTPVLPGDLVRTAAQSSVELVFEDGNRVKIWPESSFKLREKTESETHYELVSGKIHVRHHAEAVGDVIGQVEYHTVSADLAIRGTEFYLSLDGQNHTHMMMTSGKVALTALPVGVSDFNPPWWAQSLPPSEPRPLIYGKWFRVALIKGDVEIVRSDGIPRRAAVGAEVSRGERLVTKKDGFVWGLMDGDYIGAMKPESAMSAGLIHKKLVYGLGAGDFHFTAAPEPKHKEDDRPEFRTPKARVHVQTTEFEVTIDDQGESDFVPLEGPLEITAANRIMR